MCKEQKHSLWTGSFNFTTDRISTEIMLDNNKYFYNNTFVKILHLIGQRKPKNLKPACRLFATCFTILELKLIMGKNHTIFSGRDTRLKLQRVSKSCKQVSSKGCLIIEEQVYKILQKNKGLALLSSQCFSCQSYSYPENGESEIKNKKSKTFNFRVSWEDL